MLNLESLVAIALITSVASMLLSCAALWPHSKDGMASIRDAILWGAFIFMLAGAATVGWKRINATGTAMPWSPGAVNATEFRDYGYSAPGLNAQEGAPLGAAWDRGAIQPTFQTKTNPASNGNLYGVDQANSTW